MLTKFTFKDKIPFLPFLSLLLIQLVTIYNVLILNISDLDSSNYLAMGLLILNSYLYYYDIEVGLLTTGFILLLSTFGHDFVSFFAVKTYNKLSIFYKINEDKVVFSTPSMDIRIFWVLLFYLITNFKLVLNKIRFIKSKLHTT